MYFLAQRRHVVVVYPRNFFPSKFLKEPVLDMKFREIDTTDQRLYTLNK